MHCFANLSPSIAWDVYCSITLMTLHAIFNYGFYNNSILMFIINLPTLLSIYDCNKLSLKRTNEIIKNNRHMQIIFSKEFLEYIFSKFQTHFPQQNNHVCASHYTILKWYDALFFLNGIMIQIING